MLQRNYKITEIKLNVPISAAVEWHTDDVNAFAITH